MASLTQKSPACPVDCPVMWLETQHGENEMLYEKNAVTCPHCDHEYTADEMNECQTDLWALAPREETTDLECPVCDKSFFVKGSYRPQYTTAFAEEEL